jgi:hypothetical protein
MIPIESLLNVGLIRQIECQKSINLLQKEYINEMGLSEVLSLRLKLKFQNSYLKI